MAEDMLVHTDLLPQLHVARLYENYPDPRWRPGVVPENRVAVLDSMNVGYGLGLHIGHGYRNVMEVGDASITNPDASALTNGNRLMNLYAINCSSNAIDRFSLPRRGVHPQPEWRRGDQRRLDAFRFPQLGSVIPV